MDEPITPPTLVAQTGAPNPSEAVREKDPQTEKDARMIRIKIIASVSAVVVLIIGVLFFLFTRTPAQTTYLRDLVIIFMALESLVIGVALVILMVQLAVLINLLQNEIKPILNSTNETVNTLRGTATFLSDNLTEPVIKLNEYLAALRKILNMLHLGR